MKKIALTGATSMLGIALIKQCITHGIQVVAFIKHDSTNLGRLPVSPLITLVEYNLDSLSSLTLESITIDSFYHIGWVGTDKIGRDSPSLQVVNIQYTLDAVKLAQKMGCKRFIGIGSQAEYGRVNTVIAPDTPVNPETAYGVAKYCAGIFSRIECHRLGFEHIWVRVFSVYGSNDNDGTLLKTFIKNVQTDKPMKLTKCEQIWDYLHEDDAGRALFSVGINGIPDKVYCLGSGEGLVLKRYLEIIRDIINPDYSFTNDFLPYNKDQVMNLCADISELTLDIGWKPEISFKDGIKRILTS